MLLNCKIGISINEVGKGTYINVVVKNTNNKICYLIVELYSIK